MAELAMLPFSRPNISEAAIQAVAEVLRSGWITSGPWVQRLEADFCAATGAKHAIAVNNATSGLDLCLQALDLQPGDEVIVPSINWVSGPNMIELGGGTTVFCDIDAVSLNLNLAEVERLISPRTRAIMPVHFAGAPVDLVALRRLTAGRGIVILDDCAHAAGAVARGVPIGGDSELAVFSFHPTKNMTTAEGGIIACQDDDLAARLRLLRFHGIRKDAWKNHSRSGRDLYQVLEPGRKCNLPDTLAVLGVYQLADLARMNAERTRLVTRYRAALPATGVVELVDAPLAEGDRHAWHIAVILLRQDRLRGDRGDVVGLLERLGIGTALHFPPVHVQQYYRERYPGVNLPVSEDVGARLLSIPLFPGMTDADCDRVVAAFHAVARELSR